MLFFIITHMCRISISISIAWTQVHVVHWIAQRAMSPTCHRFLLSQTHFPKSVTRGCSRIKTVWASQVAVTQKKYTRETSVGIALFSCHCLSQLWPLRLWDRLLNNVLGIEFNKYLPGTALLFIFTSPESWKEKRVSEESFQLWAQTSLSLSAHSDKVSATQFHTLHPYAQWAELILAPDKVAAGLFVCCMCGISQITSMMMLYSKCELLIKAAINCSVHKN